MSSEEYLLPNTDSAAIFENSLDPSAGYLLPLTSSKYHW
jgi:hypothetical protein